MYATESLYTLQSARSKLSKYATVFYILNCMVNAMAKNMNSSNMEHIAPMQRRRLVNAKFSQV